MTLPDERVRSLLMTKNFLLDLMNRSYWPGRAVIRVRARACLKHFPSLIHLKEWDDEHRQEASRLLERIFRADPCCFLEGCSKCEDPDCRCNCHRDGGQIGSN